MEVTREVILDLLPLYFADEASADTKALVERHLESDPDLARLAKQWQERLPAPPPQPVDTEAQAEAYYRAQRQITVRTIFIACCITGGLLALLAILVFLGFSV
jgi:anti-sigma factor RsiW